MENRKVIIENMTNSRVGIDIPELRLMRIWEKKGVKKPVDFDVLKEAIYNEGVEYMFKTGILYINEMEDKIALGLEPEGATKPENIIILTDDEKKEWMSSKKQSWELKAMLEKLSYEGKKDFCDFVIENELIDGKKATVIKEVCGVDTIRSIQMKQANEAE